MAEFTKFDCRCANRGPCIYCGGSGVIVRVVQDTEDRMVRMSRIARRAHGHPCLTSLPADLAVRVTGVVHNPGKPAVEFQTRFIVSDEPTPNRGSPRVRVLEKIKKPFDPVEHRKSRHYSPFSE